MDHDRAAGVFGTSTAFGSGFGSTTNLFGTGGYAAYTLFQLLCNDGCLYLCLYLYTFL
jgi:hypothetical protein